MFPFPIIYIGFDMKEQIQDLIGHKILDIQKISGGLINYVYRVWLHERTVIVKQSPPYISSQPHIPLSQTRSIFEQQALYRLPFMMSQSRTPKLLCGTLGLFVMEDKGRLPNMQEAFSFSILRKLALWLAHLHNETYGQICWNNIEVQQTRQIHQYNALADWLSHRHRNASVKLRTLGSFLLEQGICCIMGDLWPSSILIDRDEFWVIDWEFSHYGRPLQDVAHFCAHLDLVFPQLHEGKTAKEIFLDEYQRHCRAEIEDDICSPWASIHYAAELLMRTQGVFAAHHKKQKITEHAIHILRWDEPWAWMQPIGG